MTDIEPWERGELAGQEYGRRLHRTMGVEPCDDTDCTHLTIRELSEAFARAVTEHLTQRDSAPPRGMDREAADTSLSDSSEPSA